MPGIVGMIGQGIAEECESLVKLMVASMRHERFYASGTYSAPELGLYAGWLAHENSFSDGQVFTNEKGDIALVFSGECFVDRGILSDLKRKGHSLAGDNGDWIVHLYEEEGENCVEKLNGLFSGLLIDQRQRRALLFNDRYGVERLYIYERRGEIYFASEAKALLRILPELRTFDPEGVAEFLTFGCTLGQRTLFRGIQLLPSGSVWSFENLSCCKRKYFSPETWEAQPPLSAEGFESELQQTFNRILPHYFEAGSRIGISLTGGLDTRMIMACRPKTSENPICYTFSGEKGLTLDDRLAARVADACGLEHRLLRIGPDFLSEFASHADRTVYITDGSLGILGAHEIYLNAQARHLAQVRLTGNFGSEVLRGVSTFKPLGISDDLLAREMSRFVNGSVKELPNDGASAVTFAAFREIPWKLFGSVAAGRSQLTFRTPYLDNGLVALAYRAPDHLRRSSLPASRFVNAKSAALSKIPTDRGFARDNSGPTYLLRRFVAESTFKIDYYNSEGLPRGLSLFDSVFRRMSSGLGILGLHKYLPYRHWFQRELAEYVSDKVRDAQQMPFWNCGFLNQMVRDHARGCGNYLREINAVITLQIVDRMLIQN
jgi:asparagine synthase (glutamine-hydrolysing)